jgi:DNA polymerase II small subunit
MENTTRKEILKVCMSKGFLLDSEMLEIFGELDVGSALEVAEGLKNLGIEERVITKKVFTQNFEQIKNILVSPSGEKKVIIEKFFVSLGYEREVIENVSSVGERFSEGTSDLESGGEGKVKVLLSPKFPQKKVVVRDFVNHFRMRYEFMKGVLLEKGLEDLTSVRSIGRERGNYTIIAAVLGKRVTKNKNLIFEVEDMTGTTRVLVNQNKKELFEKAKDLLVDDIVAFSVSGSSEMLFANEVIFPDCGLPEKRKGTIDEWVAFTSDFHVGSRMFLEENFLKFIKWLNGEEGDEKQREIALKVKYLFVTGDSVDGTGVFPGQERELTLQDMELQYKRLVELLKLIRKDVQIIICPGQHDAVWVGEPQPVIGENWAPGLYEMENVTLVSNPALIEIGEGFKILMYHGASMHGIIEEIQDIRLNYGHDSPTRVVKEMLKRRHLAPMHGSVDYIPCEGSDPMAISIVPDILATGDQHRSEVSIYNNILLIASSCWQSITPFEEKVGNNPDPCKVPLFNLKSREIKVVDFSDEGVDEECGEDASGEIVCEVKEGEGDKIESREEGGEAK